ncbi:hypothetical protein G6O67_000508 [Ophiocordyceps sinensis]|nr:hypothetical protein G6O67_000508 [Ophiocordyceps sinensis]
MDKLDGKPLEWDGATPAQREKIMQQLADVFLDLESHPFDAMGSLVCAADGAEVELQGLAHVATFRMGGGGPLGPFSSSVEGTHFTSRGQFFLKHPDDKGDHILVNDQFEIVGMIDWEWMQTASRAGAFCSPCMMWPVADFYNGSNDLTTDEMRLADIFRERGRHDLAECVVNGRRVQRLLFGLGPDGSFLDDKTFGSLLLGLRRAVDSSEERWEQWMAKALERWKTDESLQRLLKLEKSRKTHDVP